MVKKVKTMTLTQWLIQQIDTEKWRCGATTGSKHPEITQKEINQIGKQQLLTQAAELERSGLIQVDWREFHTDIKQIHFSVEIMDELCRRAGVRNPKALLEEMRTEIRYWKEKAADSWSERYFEDQLARVDVGKYAEDARKMGFYKCVYQISRNDEPMWKRVFSAAVLNDSKKLEKVYENHIITIMKRYSPKVQEGMTNHEIFAEHGIESYSQRLELKGPIKYAPDAGHLVDTGEQIYGAVINAQTLSKARIKEIGNIKRIMTIENKANYESMEYDQKTLYIFCHGFFSPKERRFLEQFVQSAKRDVEYLHWGDLDYGGILIYNFIQEKLFPELRPYCMNQKTYEAALGCGAGYPIEEEKLAKLALLDAGDLEELKTCILASKKEIEQEMVIAHGLS